GLNLALRVESDRGLLWLVRALEHAPPEADEDRESIRRLLDGWSGQLHALRRVWSHPGAVTAALFSSDGRIVLTSDDGGVAQLRETATGKPLGRAVRHLGDNHTVAFSPDGGVVVTISDRQTAQFWEVPAGKPLGEALPHAGTITALAFAPEGKKLVTGTS